MWYSICFLVDSGVWEIRRRKRSAIVVSADVSPFSRGLRVFNVLCRAGTSSYRLSTAHCDLFKLGKGSNREVLSRGCVSGPRDWGLDTGSWYVMVLS